MFTIAIIDTEASWTDNDIKSTMGSFETREVAEAAAHTFIDRIERLCPDWVQVYSYEIIPVRTFEQNEAYFMALPTIFNRAEYREGNAVEMGWS